MTTASSKRRRAKSQAKMEQHLARSKTKRSHTITPAQRASMAAGQQRYMAKLKAYNVQHKDTAWVIPRKGSSLHKRVFGK